MNANQKIGYFLKEKYWKCAADLVGKQLVAKKENRHFNTLSMFYYEMLGDSKELVETFEYFGERVSENMFYGLSDEFSVYSYPIPKPGLGLRRFKFFTYPLRLLYDAIGLYLLDLTQPFLDHYYKANTPNVHSFYGGRLRFKDDGNELSLKDTSNIWYRSHYKSFKKAVKKEVDSGVQGQVVMHLDIQNYFDEISISTLLKLIDAYIEPSRRKHLSYDVVTSTQIQYFFELIMGGTVGIPQSDNELISSFIGYLYLVFGDLFIDDELQRSGNDLVSYRVIRYVDDIYLSLIFPGTTSRRDCEVFTNFIASRISDMLYSKLGLRLNSKTKVYWLDDPGQKEELLEGLKKVSTGYIWEEISLDEDNVSKRKPQDSVDKIIQSLEKLQKDPWTPTYENWNDKDEEALKEIYDKAVGNLIKSPQNRERLKGVFADFNFDMVYVQPREIIILILLNECVGRRFKECLLDKDILTTRDVFFILIYLCQTSFEHDDLVKLLEKNQYMQGIVKVYQSGSTSSDCPGYYRLSWSKILRVSKSPNVIEQIRLRVLSERSSQYSVALNHLLNELQSICYDLDQLPNKKDLDSYRAPDVIRFLRSRMVPHSIRVTMRNLFDRRNKNPVSHADPHSWLVERKEYYRYRKKVGECLDIILDQP